MTTQREEFYNMVNNAIWGKENIKEIDIETIWSWHQQSLDRAVKKEKTRIWERVVKNLRKWAKVSIEQSWIKVGCKKSEWEDDDEITSSLLSYSGYWEEYSLTPPVDVKKEKSWLDKQPL